MNVLETCIHDPLSEFVRKGEDAKDRFFPAAHPPLQGQHAPVLILRLSFSDFVDAAPSAPIFLPPSSPFLLLPPSSSSSSASSTTSSPSTTSSACSSLSSSSLSSSSRLHRCERRLYGEVTRYPHERDIRQVLSVEGQVQSPNPTPYTLHHKP
jgi:hypothetical protein